MVGGGLLDPLAEVFLSRPWAAGFPRIPADSDGATVLVVKKSKNIKIGKLSVYPDEEECLILPGARYVVTIREARRETRPVDT